MIYISCTPGWIKTTGRKICRHRFLSYEIVKGMVDFCHDIVRILYCESVIICESSWFVFLSYESYNSIAYLILMHLSKSIMVTPPGRPQDYGRGTSDHTGDSDIILTLQMVEIYIFLGGILTVSVSAQDSFWQAHN